MVPEGVLSPFLYLFDIAKDLIQLALIVYAVHGFHNVFENWSSFSSVVSIQTQKNIFDGLANFFVSLRLYGLLFCLYWYLYLLLLQ